MKSKPRHHEHKTLVFTIIHDETSNIVDHGFGRTTWTSQRKRFAWEIVRPDKGTKALSRTCPYCSKELDLQVDSIEFIQEQIAFGRKIGPICAVLCPIFLAVFVGGMFAPPSIQHNQFFFGLFVTCVICFFGSLLPLSIWLSPPGPGYSRTSLSAALQIEGTLSTFGGHYVESVTSY
jgi:hypothetical protein